jgi:hypothetical protein
MCTICSPDTQPYICIDKVTFTVEVLCFHTPSSNAILQDNTYPRHYQSKVDPQHGISTKNGRHTCPRGSLQLPPSCPPTALLVSLIFACSDCSCARAISGRNKPQRAPRQTRHDGTQTATPSDWAQRSWTRPMTEMRPLCPL